MGLMTAVLRKETLDHVRDRRSMMSALVTPILWPVIFGALFSLLASWESSDRPLKISVRGAENAPGLMAFLKRNGAEIDPASEAFEQKVKDGDADVVVVIPKDYAEHFSQGKSASLEVYEDSSNNKTRRSVERTKSLLRLYSGEMGALRLLARGVAPSLVQAVEVDERDVATKQQQAANLLNMIPLLLLLAAFIGGMHVAIDTTAGERERGSLEPLLINPVPRLSIVMGKWLATVMVASLGLMTTLVGFVVVIRRVPLSDLGVKVNLGGHELIGILLAMVPLLFFTAALQMLVSTYARSFKEAQTYLSLVMLLPTLPGMMLSFSPFKTQPWMMAVPTLGQQLLVSKVMRGETWNLGLFAVAAVGALGASALCLGLMTRLLGQEKVIFGR